MRKLLCILLVLVMLSAMAVPALAADMEVLFTDDSSLKVGGHLEIDFAAMMTDSRVTSEIYNAILEKHYEIYWYRNGEFHATQPKVIFGDADAGASFSVEIRFYGDKACTELWATLMSKEYKVESSALPMVLRTTKVNDGAVGMFYSFQFEASDPGAEFSLYRSSAPDGLTLAKDGTLSGVPTKAGQFTMTVVASGVGGQASYTYNMAIGGEMAVVKIMTETLPDAVVGKAYSTKLECSDKSATFGIYFNPGKANEFEATGLKLAEDGTLSGTPAKAGTYTFWVGAYGMAEEQYKEFTLTVADSAETVKKPLKGKNDRTETQAEETEKADGVEMPMWAVVLVALGAMLVGAVVVLVILKTKRN